MAIRNVLDQSGSIIGTMTLPDSTTEDVWTYMLSVYSSTTPLSSVPNLTTFNIIGTGSVTTSSSTPSVIGGMTVTPPKGTYVVTFNGGIYTAGASATGDFGIYVGGSLLTETRRDISCNLTLLGGLVTISLNSIGVGTNTGSQIDLDGTQTIDVRFRSTNGGTIGFNERVVTLIKVK